MIKSILHFENTIDKILVYQKRNLIVITNMNKNCFSDIKMYCF